MPGRCFVRKKERGFSTRIRTTVATAFAIVDRDTAGAYRAPYPLGGQSPLNSVKEGVGKLVANHVIPTRWHLIRPLRQKDTQCGWPDPFWPSFVCGGKRCETKRVAPPSKGRIIDRYGILVGECLSFTDRFINPGVHATSYKNTEDANTDGIRTIIDCIECMDTHKNRYCLGTCPARSKSG